MRSPTSRLFRMNYFRQYPEPLGYSPFLVAQGFRSCEEPTVHTVGSPFEAIFDLDWFTALQRPRPQSGDSFQVIRMNHRGPAGTLRLFESHPREIQPELVGEVDPPVRPSCPDDSR